LHIIKLKKRKEFDKSKIKKPSQYLKENWGNIKELKPYQAKNLKKDEFVKEFYKEITILSQTIEEYHKKHRKDKKKKTLFNLCK
jgi:hypothetical protein